MITTEYKAKPLKEKPLLDELDSETIIAWFRCNSCITCLFRKNVIDQDEDVDIYWCSKMHEKSRICEMCNFLGYSKE